MLALLGGSVAAAGLGGQVGAQEGWEPAGEVREVVSMPGDLVPENLAFDGDGDLYFGITAGQVRRLPADRTGETGLTLEDTRRVAALPGSVIGVESDVAFDPTGDGDLFVCNFANPRPEEAGILRTRV